MSPPTTKTDPVCAASSLSRTSWGVQERRRGNGPAKLVDHHQCAAVGEEARAGAAEPATTARYDHDLVLRSGHVDILHLPNLRSCFESSLEIFA